ncbi:MAG: amino acid decarboxylase [Verrucomicrobia bacterium]|nr:MAG: amino acid decarboxylase [Verrucomicrobiota bacterium]
MKDSQSVGDTPPEEFRKQLHELADWIADFREHIEELRVAPDDKPGAISAQLPAQAPEEGEPFGKILDDINRLIIPGMAHWSHPMFLGYFGWTTTAPGILGEIISAPLNVNAMTWRTCPAATELESVVINWIRQWVGLPRDFDGVVYDTASVGIMHALAVAREEASPSTRKDGLIDRDLPRFRVYTSDQAHNAAEKAAIALGIGKDNVRRVPSDGEFQMEMSILRKAITEDRQSGFKPIAVVATAGTTSTASVDPIPELARLCREEEMWLHIDAAYGGGFAILPEFKWIAEGWSDADSVIINPHKSLFVPLDFSVLYVRDLERLRRVFTLAPPDVLRGDTMEAARNYMDYGIQLGRRFRALKAWVIFRSLGREGIASRLRESVRLAQVLADWIKSDNRFKLVAPVSMGVVCFRFVRAVVPTRRGDAGPGSPTPATEERLDQLNSEIVERINASGRAYLTQTKLRGRTVMRIGLGNVLTTEEHLRKAWEIILETASEL